MSRGQKLTAMAKAKYALDNAENSTPPPASPCPSNLDENSFQIFSKDLDRMFAVTPGAPKAASSDSPPRKVLRDLSSNRTANNPNKNAAMIEKRKVSAVRRVLHPIESPARAHGPEGGVDIFNSTALSMLSCYDSEADLLYQMATPKKNSADDNNNLHLIDGMATPKKNSADDNNNLHLIDGAPPRYRDTWANSNEAAQEPSVVEPLALLQPPDMDSDMDSDMDLDKDNNNNSYSEWKDLSCSTPLVPEGGMKEVNISPLHCDEQGHVVNDTLLTPELPLSGNDLAELPKDAETLLQSDTPHNATTISFLGEFDVTDELCDNVIAVLDASAGDALVVPLDVEIPNTADQAHDTQDEEALPNDVDDTPKPRSRNPLRWKKVDIKRKKDLGLAHISQRGKVRKECREVAEACKNTCKRKCSQVFTEDDRKSVNAAFWDIGNHTQQWYYIKGLVKEEEVKRRTVITLHGMRPYRRATYTYHLPLNGTQVVVCQKMFVSTLNISVTWIKTALKKFKENNGTIPCDGRGKKPKKAVVSTVIKAGIMAHIKKFPTVEGHYTRKNSKSMYLAENLNRRKMWSIYKIEMEAAGEKQIGTLRQYRDVFNKEFRLKFFRPKKDQCPKCLSWKHKTPQERTEEAQQKYESHIKNKKISQEIKEKDIEEVLNSPELRKTKCLVSCDLEKVLMCPKGDNGEFYYASKLSVYNFTIFVSGDQESFCYVWDQTIAGKGAAEIGSCLWSFIQKKVEEGIKEFLIYSDNCSPQNKNQFLFSMYVMASIRFNIKITHLYLEVGHTHMECDSIHATIEKSVKHTDIFVPSQWYQAIKTAKKTRPLYKVKEMSQEEIFDFRPLAEHQLWENIRTSLFREVSIDGENPGQIAYKTDMEGPSTVVNIFKKTRGRPVNWHTYKLSQRYLKRIPLREVELKALQGLCKSGAIPSAYWPYYNISLPAILAEPTPPPELSDVDSDLSSNEDSDDSGEEDEGGEENGEEEDSGEEEEEEMEDGNDSDWVDS